MNPMGVERVLRVLVVEDNRDIAENITDYLEGKGYVTDYAMDGPAGLHLALTEVYDVIVLDVMLPGMDGLTVCRKLREDAENSVPVLMLTARDTLDDKLTGFNSGADDYLVKPFALQELEVRIQALSKRGAPVVRKKMCVGDLELDTDTLTVTRGGRVIELNKAGLNILKVLMSASPKVVSRSELEHSLWGDMPPGSDSLRSHLYSLRQKIDKPFDQNLIHTVHGIGFKIDAQQ